MKRDIGRQIRGKLGIGLTILIMTLAGLTGCGRKDGENMAVENIEMTSDLAEIMVEESESSKETEEAETKEATVTAQTTEPVTERPKTDIEKIEEIIGQNFPPMYVSMAPTYRNVDLDRDGIEEYLVSYYEDSIRYTCVFEPGTLEEIPIEYSMEELKNYISSITITLSGKINDTNRIQYTLVDKAGNTMEDEVYINGEYEDFDNYYFEDTGLIYYDEDMGMYLSSNILVPVANNDGYERLSIACFYFEYDEENNAFVLSDNYYFDDLYVGEINLDEMVIEDKKYYEPEEFKVYSEDIIYSYTDNEVQPCEVVVDGVRRAAVYYGNTYIIYYREEGCLKHRYIIIDGDEIGTVLCQHSIKSRYGDVQAEDVDDDGDVEYIFRGYETGTDQNVVYTDVIRTNPIKHIPINYEYDTLAAWVEESGQFDRLDWKLYDFSFNGINYEKGTLSAYTVVGAVNPKNGPFEYYGDITAYLSYMPDTDSFEYNGKYEIEKYASAITAEEKVEAVINQSFAEDKDYPKLTEADVDGDGVKEYIVRYKEDSEYYTRVFEPDTMEEIIINFEYDMLYSYINSITEVSREVNSQGYLVVTCDIEDKQGDTYEAYIWNADSDLDINESVKFMKNYTVKLDFLMNKLYVSTELIGVHEDGATRMGDVCIYFEYNEENNSFELSDNYRIGDINKISFAENVNLSLLLKDMEVYYDKADFEIWSNNKSLYSNSDFRRCEVVVEGSRKDALYLDDLYIIHYGGGHYIIKKGDNIGMVKVSVPLEDRYTSVTVSFADMDGDGCEELIFDDFETGTGINITHFDIVRISPTVKNIPINYDFDVIEEYVRADGRYEDIDWCLEIVEHDAVKYDGNKLRVETAVLSEGKIISSVWAYFSYMPETDSFELNGEYKIGK